MQKIHTLSEQIIAKIAAGEVIERPVYAVKELVENSIDADADMITVQIEESGLKRITVIDNGEGMSREDIAESFKPHTTSKLATPEQLLTIKTHGFRGEALSSIAAISRMHMQSKTKEATVGTSIELLEGKVKKVTPIGMPQGTTITVYNLFYPVPARKKFLKSQHTEYRHILELITRFAIAHPTIRFALVNNGKMIFDLPITGENVQAERMRLLLGEKIFSKLLPIIFEDTYIKLSGFLTKPQVVSQTTRKQYLTINGRNVTDKLITQVVKDAYGTLLESNAYPIYFLSLSIPYEFVDVNVHPRKEHVRFIDSQRLYDAIHRGVAETLTKNNLIFFADVESGFGLSDEMNKKRFGYTKSFAGKIVKENQIPWDVRPLDELVNFADNLQLHNLYLVSSTKQGLVLIDQHAAHERILYEQFLQAFKTQQKEQPQMHLAKPIFIDFSLSDSELLQENIALFQKLGFAIEHFKKNSFFVHSVPLFFKDRNIAELISEILTDLLQEKHPKEVDKVSQRMIAYLACRAAIKRGDRLTKKQAKELIEKLEQTPNKTTCPHGRPTTVVIDLKKINALFKR